MNKSEDSNQYFDILSKMRKSNTKENVAEILDLTSITMNIKNETIKFAELLKHHLENGIELKKERFWHDNQKELPHLFKIALVLNTMLPATALLERYFSVMGVTEI